MIPIEYFYLIVVVTLFLLAVSDLVVGVGNDAVNFLTGAIGSRAANFKVIMWVATIGVVIGTTFSSGMMEIARNGIFFPEKFLFSDVMIIFLAVMFTDVILLDFFNTVGLPTSTTVSIIFELLGSAVMVALLKTIQAGLPLGEVSMYINTASALGIMRGILVSVILAFTVGALIQYIARMIFTFDWEKTYKYYASAWGGLAISAITYFILIKGAKGSTIISPDMAVSIKENTGLILLFSFLGWTILLQLMSSIFKVNILKIIVLFGTFALAMAFAGNDLVNFIGAPMAGYESYRIWAGSQGHAPDGLTMGALNNAIQTPTFFLITAGIIMALTLWFSKKAKTVTKTSVDLARQSDGTERFKSNFLGRIIVRGAMLLGKLLSFVIPARVQKNINKRFKQVQPRLIRDKDKPAFDLVRGSVNLVVASALIALGTSLKLPLSTTYVTFMVAMGTSFTDKAWGRESAVYRVSGVLVVIGGWFLTALVAFTVSAVIASLLFYGNAYAVAGMIVVSVFILLRTHAIHKDTEKQEKKHEEDLEVIPFDQQLVRYNRQCSTFIGLIPEFIGQSFDCLIREKLNKSIRTLGKVKKASKEIKALRNTAPAVLRKYEALQAEAAYHYMQSVDQMKEIADNTVKLIQHIVNYLDNLHPTIHQEQAADLKLLSLKIEAIVKQYCIYINDHVEMPSYDFQDSLDDIYRMIEEINQKQVSLIKQEKISNRNSLLFSNILHELRNIMIHLEMLTGYHRKFNSLATTPG